MAPLTATISLGIVEGDNEYEDHFASLDDAK